MFSFFSFGQGCFWLYFSFEQYFLNKLMIGCVIPDILLGFLRTERSEDSYIGPGDLFFFFFQEKVLKCSNDFM